MIGSFADHEAERIFDGLRSRRYAGLESVLERKLLASEAAVVLRDLTVLPANRLEALKGAIVRVGTVSV